jgi:hypothetical protein
MRGLTTFFVGIAAVVGLGANGLHALEGQLHKLIPGISVPNLPVKVPPMARTQAAPVVAPVAKESGKGKAKTIAGGATKAIPFVAGAAAGSELADHFGEQMPGNTGMISQTPGDCYTETNGGYQHVPCSDAKQKNAK